jgi:hypothetical protein
MLRQRLVPHLFAALAALAAPAAVACSGRDRVAAPAGELALGTWGGDGAGVIVTDSVLHVHIGCTFGDVAGRVALDASGRFTRDGAYVLRAYPVLVGPSLPAQFSGVVEGKRLTLAVAVNDTTQGKVVSLGPVMVTFGEEPKLGPCPICTVNAMRRADGVGAPPAR